MAKKSAEKTLEYARESAETSRPDCNKIAENTCEHAHENVETNQHGCEMIAKNMCMYVPQESHKRYVFITLRRHKTIF
jgi:hypothetical protein